MRLTPGEPAPTFALADLSGRTRSLEECRGTPVWIAIFRFSACPFCLRRVHRLGLASEHIGKLSLRRFAIFPSPPHLLKKYLSRFPIPFEVLTDPNETVTNRYGLERSVARTAMSLGRPSHVLEGIRAAEKWNPLDGGGSKFRIPADFLLDAQHRVQVAYYGTQADDGIPLEDVYAFAGQAATH